MGVNVWNPPEIMRWNADTGYLRELEARGTAIVPTDWHKSGTNVDLAVELRRYGWSEIVIRPSMSAGSRRTWHLTAPFTELDQLRLDEILVDTVATIQPFTEAIRTESEW